MNISFAGAEAAEVSSSQVKNFDVSAQRTLRLILQFLREQKLVHSFQCLQKESGVLLSAVENIDNFVQDVVAGNMKTLLEVCGHTKLPKHLLFDVFEHVCCELLSANNYEAFREFFANSAFKSILDDVRGEMKPRLDRLAQFTEWDDPWTEISQTKRRKYIAKSVAAYLTPMAPNQLLECLARGPSATQAAPTATSLSACPPSMVLSAIALPSAPTPAKLAAVVLGNAGSRLAVCGTTAGEFFRVDWQGHPTVDVSLLPKHAQLPCTAAALSHDGQVLATGDSSGTICFWRLSEQKLSLQMKNHHPGAITCIQFHPRQPAILTVGTDNVVKVTKIISCAATLNIRSTDTDAPATQAFFDPQGKHIIVCTTTGSLRFYSNKAGATPHKVKQVTASGKIARYKRSETGVLVISRNQITLTDWSGNFTHELKPQTTGIEFEDAEGCGNGFLLVLQAYTKLAERKLAIYDLVDNKFTQEVAVTETADRVSVDNTGGSAMLWRTDGCRITPVVHA